MLNKMYRFCIIAYDRKLTQEDMGDHYHPGALEGVTEIWLMAETAAEAMAEARKIMPLKPNFHIRMIDKFINLPPGVKPNQNPPPGITPGQGIIQ